MGRICRTLKEDIRKSRLPESIQKNIDSAEGDWAIIKDKPHVYTGGNWIEIVDNTYGGSSSMHTLVGAINDDKFITPQSFHHTKWLPAGMQGVKENKGNCRNCGANSYKNNKCNYCGTNN